jgi:hypothetical protein
LKFFIFEKFNIFVCKVKWNVIEQQFIISCKIVDFSFILKILKFEENYFTRPGE